MFNFQIIKTFKATVCQQFGGLVTIKDQAGLDDLYNLYKQYPNYYFWIGATSV